MEILKRIEDTYPKMTRKQKKIADYMVSHAENMAFITLRELSREVEITEITILNMCKALGYESFNEVKYEFRKYINRGRVEFFDDNDYYNTNIPKYELDEKETLLQEICNEEKLLMDEFIKSLDIRRMFELADYFLQYSKIIICGRGISYLIGESISSSLAGVQIPTIKVNTELNENVYSVLNDIQYFYSVSDFFWESGFYESLKSDEKRKYMSFNPLSFDYSRYEQDNTVYDEELPYFSVIVKTVVLEKYSAYLRKKKESKVQAEMQPQQKEPQPIQDKCQEPKIISHIAETENPFKSILNDRQIALLVDCINEVEIFNAPMTFEDLKAILSCKPKVIFRSNNNRQVAFLFSELSNRGLITPNWQSVIAKNKLFVTKNIKKDKYLNQGDLATAANYVKGVEHEKDYVTISNYIKQLKKL